MSLVSVLPAPRTRRISGVAAGFVCLAFLGGCASLPSSGPTASQIFKDQKALAGTPMGFTITDIDGNSIAQLAAPIDDTQALVGLTGADDVDRIGPGDVLQISIFEIGTSLFAPKTSSVASAGGGVDAPTSAGAAMPPIVVGRDGTVTLPWMGQVPAAGRTPDELAEMIKEALRGKSQDPQVVVSVSNNIANTVMVIGEVRKPGRIPLTLDRERLLDAIALAGGNSDSITDSRVRISRGPTSAAAPLSAIAAGSAADVQLRPLDRIELLYRPRTFTVFGATSKVSEIPFTTPRVTLAEALARASGPADQQADPTAVFIFRWTASNPDGGPAPGAKPIAYRLNLMHAESYFLSQAFEMHGGDVIYIANARSNLPIKMVQVLNLFFQPAYTARVVSQ